MAGFILIFFCISAGLITSRCGILPRDSYKAINFWVLYFGMPALVIRYLSVVNWKFDLLLPAVGPLLVWGGAWIYVQICQRIRPMSLETRAVLLIACGLGNTAFFGYPAVTAFYGSSGMTTAVVFDVMTSVLFCLCGISTVLKASFTQSTAGAVPVTAAASAVTQPVAGAAASPAANSTASPATDNPATPASSGGSGGQVNYRQLAWKIFTFPTFLTTVIVLCTAPFLDYSHIFPFVDLIVPTVSPLALFSIGLQFNFKDKNPGAGFAPIFMGFGYKLLMAPVLMLLAALFSGTSSETGQVSVFMAGMPSHVLACVTASQFNLNPRMCAIMVAITIAGAMLSLPLWSLLLAFYL